MRQLIVFILSIISVGQGFAQESAGSDNEYTLHIVDSNIDWQYVNTSIHYSGWFRRNGSLYDSSGVIYDAHTNRPFSGRIKLYHAAGQLSVELNLLDGLKYGWQTAYHENGVVYIRYHCDDHVSSSSFSEKNSYELYQYYDTGQLEKSFILVRDTLIFKEKNYYPSGKIASEGDIKFITQTIKYSATQELSILAMKAPKRVWRKARKEDRLGKGGHTVTLGGWYKNGHWRYYNENGILILEGDYEVEIDIYGELHERRIGEWKEYNK